MSNFIDLEKTKCSAYNERSSIFAQFTLIQMKNKKWLMLLIIGLPSFLWIILETSTINSYKLNYYGPKILNEKNDTVFYTVSDQFSVSPPKNSEPLQSYIIDVKNHPFYALMFINKNYQKDAYRLKGLWEYLNYENEKVGHIPFFLVTESADNISVAQVELEKLTKNSNVKFLTLSESVFDSLNKTYFVNKPYYVDYSFFALVDNNRNIRGFYDSRFASEIKRLTGEYRHLRLQVEKNKLIQNNEIKANTK